MKAYRAESVPTDGVEHGKGAYIRWVIDREHGAPNFVMRVIEIEAGGNTPLHIHDQEHEVYMLEGQGELRGPGGTKFSEIAPGDVALVLPREEHQFVNTGDTTLRMICVIPFLDRIVKD